MVAPAVSHPASQVERSEAGQGGPRRQRLQRRDRTGPRGSGDRGPTAKPGHGRALRPAGVSAQPRHSPPPAPDHRAATATATAPGLKLQTVPRPAQQPACAGDDVSGVASRVQSRFLSHSNRCCLLPPLCRRCARTTRRRGPRRACRTRRPAAPAPAPQRPATAPATPRHAVPSVHTRRQPRPPAGRCGRGAV